MLADATGYDPFSEEVLRDPGPASQWLLSSCPAHRFDGFDPPFWTLSRYEDVLAATRDSATFSSRYGQGPHFTEERGMKSDAPVHTFFRKLVAQAFTPRAVERMAPRIENIVRELIDGFVQRGEADLYEEFASPLPTIVIAEMLGVPAHDRSMFKVWSDAWVAAMGAADPAPYQQRIREMRSYLLEQVVVRQERLASGGEPSDDLITSLVRAEDGGERLSGEDVVNVVRQLLVGGNETTASLLTNLLVRLTDEPGRLARLAEEPALVDAAVEESLRFDSPVLGLFRTTTCPVEKHGTVIPAGAKVMLHFGAANRDPSVFDEPDSFSLDRDPAQLRKHLAFGSGVHVCIGAALSRLEGRIALRQLVERLPGLTITGPTERVAPFMLWGRASLPARWDVP